MLPLLLPLALLLPPAVATAGSEADFRTHFARVRELCDSGRWKTAGAELDRMLTEHRGAGYVTPHAVELVELYERCTFFGEHGELGPRELSALVDGELLAWDRASGRIALSYSELPGDFEEQGEVTYHPVEFTGPYEIEVVGRMPRTATTLTPPQILACVTQTDSHQVVFGFPRVESETGERWIPGKILHNGRSSRVLDEKKDTPLRLGREYTVGVEVTATRITASVNGRAFLSATKERELYGRVALLACPDVRRVSLTGIANPAWIEGLADAERERRRRAFLATWDPSDHVPAWLLAHVPEPAEASPSSAGISFRRTVRKDQMETLRELSELEPAEGLRFLGSLEPGALPAEIVFFYAGVFATDLDMLDHALESVERSLEVDPEFAEASALRVRVLTLLGERDAARDQIAELLATEPDSVFAWAECARSLLRLGEPEEARTVAERALRRGIPPEALAEVQGVLVRALEGPTWARVHEYRSGNYEVRSDVGRQDCFDAATVLEESLSFYERRLGRLGRRENGLRFDVYLFSGRSGYDAYAADLFDAAPESTAGLYSPLLKQLLVWSQPDRADTMRTLRHEGLHQYLDGLGRRPPTWFDEGMAEYFENVVRERGAVLEGAPQEHHVARLTGPSPVWIPYEQLLALPHERFYADSAQHYAQSWALVHWLLSGGLAEQRVFQKLLDDLKAGVDPDEIHARLLSVGDLDGKVRAHLTRLARDA